MSGSIHVVVVCSEFRGLTLAVRVWLGYSSPAIMLCLNLFGQTATTATFWRTTFYTLPTFEKSVFHSAHKIYIPENWREREGLKPLFLTSFKMITYLH